MMLVGPMIVEPSNQYNTAFITPWGTFFWVMVPFGLKDAGEDYQRSMILIFHDYIHKILEDYVNYILAKSLNWQGNMKFLWKIFETMWTYNMRFNPNKIIFGVDSGFFLGFITSHRGIKVDMKKIDSIVNMPLPMNISQLSTLQGIIYVICHFLASLGDWTLPFMHLLKKEFDFNWNGDFK
jgi:hypothetical protein